MRNSLSAFLLSSLCSLCLCGASSADWQLGTAYKIPSQYTNQESGYFSIIEGHNGRIYIGAAKYGVDAYLIEFDPKTKTMSRAVDVHKVIGSDAKGFAAQAKIHTRNNVGESGTIWFGSKQGYPEKGEKRDDYLGGYVLSYDPKTGKTEHYGIPKKNHGVISVAPDESRGRVYVSTCSDERPIEHSNFMVLDLKTKHYRDLGDTEQMYAFIVVDDKGRAYHPVRGGTVMRFEPETDKAERLKITIDGAAPSKVFTRDDTILNWEVSPDRKTLYAVEMTTNALYAFDLTATGDTLPGKNLGPLLPGVKGTDCRSFCVGADGTVWAAVKDMGAAEGETMHLVSYKPGARAPRDHGPVGIANPDFTTFNDASGKQKPWHHTIRKSKDGTLTPWQPLGIAAAKDGTVYVMTLAPFTLLQFPPESLK